MRDRLRSLPHFWNWLLLALAGGLFVGFMLGRVTAYSVGWPAIVATVLLTLLEGGALAVGGWLIGREQRASRIDDWVAGGPDAPREGQAIAEEVVADRPDQEPAAGANGGLVVERPPQEPQLIAGGHALALLRKQDRLLIEAHDILGYQHLRVTFRFADGRARLGGQEDARTVPGSAAGWLRPENSLPLALFAASLLLYAFTRLFALDRFPINFFADEANQVLNGLDLARNGFRDAQGNVLPFYIQLFSFWYPDITVYLHSVTASLFGLSIDVARATTGLLSIPLAAGLALAMKKVFDARYWWSAVLLLAMTPAWLLWSRTAFDPAASACLYGLTVVCYLFYRYRSPRYVYLLLVLAGATFYSYPSAQPAIAVLALLLLVSDLRYHVEQAKRWFRAVPIALVLAIPFLRFYLQHPSETTSHLHAVNSYLLLNTPLLDKITRGLEIYLEILSPLYWFFPNPTELIRHEMKGYGFLPLIGLPLFLIGVVLCIRRFRESKYRVVLASLLAAPVGAAVAQPAIIRELAFIAPATLVSAIGLEWVLGLIKSPRAVAAAPVAAFVLLAAMGVALFQDALANGPTWYSDYTLYGMQWGAEQVFQRTIPQLVADNPNATIFVSDTWANGTDVFLRFFNTDPSHVQMRNINAWLAKKEPMPADSIFVMTYDEYDKAKSSPKLRDVQALSTIKYPDGRDGFYIARAQYADNVDQIFAAEREALRQLMSDKVTIDGEVVDLKHTKFDIGAASSMFDNDPYTVARGVEANPLILDFSFPKPRSISGLDIWLGRSDAKVAASLFGPDSAAPVVYTSEFNNSSISLDNPAGPDSHMSFSPTSVVRLRLEISYPQSDDSAHVHVFELKLH